MATKRKSGDIDEVAQLLKHLLAIELYRSGLSKGQIRAQLGLDNNVVSRMLLNVNRHVLTRTDDAE